MSRSHPASTRIDTAAENAVPNPNEIESQKAPDRLRHLNRSRRHTPECVARGPAGDPARVRYWLADFASLQDPPRRAFYLALRALSFAGRVGVECRFEFAAPRGLPGVSTKEDYERLKGTLEK